MALFDVFLCVWDVLLLENDVRLYSLCKCVGWLIWASCVERCCRLAKVYYEVSRLLAWQCENEGGTATNGGF